MMASAALVAFYSAAVRFHRLAGDRPAFALPATALGAGAAITLVRYFIPLVEGRSPAGFAAAGVKPRNRRAN